MTTIKTYRLYGLCFALVSGAALGCSDNNAGTGSGAGGKGAGGGAVTTTTGGNPTTGGTTTGGTGGSGGGSSKAVTYCDPTKWSGGEPQPVTMTDCSDFDSDSSPTGIHCIMPGGIWDVDVDTAGTTKANSYKIEACGTTGNGFHFVGMGHTGWGADAAAAIVSQTQPVDVSGYSGLSFVMKSTTANALIFKVQNPYSQPPCGKCDDTVLGSECYSGFIKNISLPANSTTPIVVKWSDLSQQTWGYHAPGVATFDPANLISVAFAFDKGIDFDVCIDDIKFVP
jgi:hypothetical protein